MIGKVFIVRLSQPLSIKHYGFFKGGANSRVYSAVPLDCVKSVKICDHDFGLNFFDSFLVPY